MSERLFDRYPFLGIKHLQKNKSSLPRPIEKKNPTKASVKKSTANGFAFGSNCTNGLRFRKGNGRI